MSEYRTVFVVVIVLQDKGQIIHMAFDDLQAAEKYAAELEPSVNKLRSDFLHCSIVPIQLCEKQAESEG